MLHDSLEQPSEDEIAEAIEAKNGSVIARYAVAVQYHRNRLAEQLPQKIEGAANAKRDLDVTKAAIKNADETVKLLQSVLRQVRPT